MLNAKRAAIYLRVSTGEQKTDAQETELKRYTKARGWLVQKVYADRGVSGAKMSRPALDQLMADCRKRKADVVVVWKFDRFARSLRHLVTALEEFRRLGIDFVSCTEAIDTSVPSGELVFQIFGAIAQFERALIGERVRAGVAHARAQGKRLGRPPIRTLTREERARMRKDRYEKKLTLRKLATKYGVSVWSAYNATASRAGI
jgi:DNA invertase Pin-like site-specific DNA recombinase